MRRQLRAATGGLVLFALLSGLSLVYAASGGGARDRQVTLLFIYVILAVSLQVFIGNSGVFSLGHMGLAGVGAYTTVILSAAPDIKQLSIPDAPLGLAGIQVSPVTAVLLGVVLATLVAAVAGLAIARLNGLAALIVTLALLVVINTVLTNWASLTGGAEAFYGYPLVADKQWAMLAALAAITTALVFRESQAGVRLQSTREDELAAGAVGVGVARTRYVGWVLSSGLAALGGILLALFVGATNPQEYFLHLTLVTLAMLVLGGMRSVAGAVVGAVVIFAGTEFTRYLGDGPVVSGVDLPPLFGLSTLFLGAVILLVMLLRPEGLVGDQEVHQLFVRTRMAGRPRSDSPQQEQVGHRSDRAEVASRDVHLAVTDVTKRFAGLVALDQVSLDVRGGEVVGLIGPNGAGKTTLINVITAMTSPTSGSISLNGVDLRGAGPAEVARIGIGRTFQNLRLFTDLTVRQNIEVAASIAERHRDAVRGDTVGELLAQFELQDVAGRRAGTLPYGSQRQLEMARGVALRPDVLLLDEPAAGMNRDETSLLLSQVRAVRDQLGCGVMVVDHDLHFIMSVCDRIYVLNGGAIIAVGTPAEVQRDPDVVSAYLGKRQGRAARQRGAVDDTRSAAP